MNDLFEHEKESFILSIQVSRETQIKLHKEICNDKILHVINEELIKLYLTEMPLLELQFNNNNGVVPELLLFSLNEPVIGLTFKYKYSNRFCYIENELHKLYFSRLQSIKHYYEQNPQL